MSRPLYPHPPAVAEFVAAARDLVAAAWAEVSFDSPSWSLKALRRSAHKRSNANVHFTRNGSTTAPLPPVFAEVVKAACVHDRKSASKMNNTVAAARWLWDAIEQRRGGDGSGFVWAGLTPDDLLAAEACMLAANSESTTYVYCGCLARMVEVLAGHGVVAPMSVEFVTPRPSSHGGHRQQSDQEAAEKMPSLAAIRALGELYRTATDPAERLVLGALALLLATGLRVGEVLTLPVDCDVEEERDGTRHYGLRFNKEKSAGRQRVLETRWLTPQQTLLARAVIAEVRALTEPARRQAALVERNPARMTFDRALERSGRWQVATGYAWDDTLTTAQVEAVMGWGAGTDMASHVTREDLPRRLIDRRMVFRAADVLTYLQKIREERCRVTIDGVVSRGDGTVQMPSQTLFVAALNWMHPRRGSSPFLVDMLHEQQLNDALRARRGSPSIFARYGYTEADGAPIRMHTHQFRHWVTTLAKRVGVEDEVLMRWHGREHAGDLDAYTHLTQAERLGALRNALTSGRLTGDVADIYFALAEDERDAFLEGQLVAVHVTSVGLCVHDFNSAPCERALGCLGCSDYLHDTSDPKEREQLVQLERRLVSVLEQSTAARATGHGELADGWVAHHEEKLANVRAVLGAAPTGTDPRVRPFADQPSRFVPWS